ncbi:MAG TPA: site-2 protease family protein [Thermomicrobiales bacterium]|nr:site-2 protease family protein [Thermomicrobiales bacterium]
MFNFDARPPEIIFAIFFSFIIATTIHEFMHAWTAKQLGDDTAERLGRVTFNPVMHFEPFGLIGMFLISIGVPAIGWGKPVPVNPSRLRAVRGRGQLGMGIVALAGPVSNVVQAGIIALGLRAASSSGIDLGSLRFYLEWFVWVNILLASFNMIPIPPLDGHKILMAVLPNFWYPVLAPLERYGFIILLVLIFVGGSAGASVISAMISPMRDLLLGIMF